MSWEIAITLAAIGLLALLHAAFAPREVAPAAAATEPAVPAGGEPWGRWLAAAALVAAAIALAVLAVPSVFGGGGSSTSGTHPTTTLPTTTTPPPGTSTTTTTTTRPTTTHPTTTHSTTTTATHPTTTTGLTTSPPGPGPAGSAVLVRGTVSGSGQLVRVENRLGGTVTVRQVSPGAYRVALPALGPSARRRSVVHVSAGGRTTVIGGWSAQGRLVVLTWDKQTGKPAGRTFSFVVIGPRKQSALPRTT